MNQQLSRENLTVFVCSDLHIDFMTNEERELFTLPDADVYLIAGDLMNGVKLHFCNWVLEKTSGKLTYFIPGNHEYYGLRRDKALRRLNEFFAGSNVTVLLDSYSEILPGLAVYGTDYWTDMNLYGNAADIKHLAKSKMNDYRAITYKARNSYRKLSPSNTIEWHLDARKKLEEFSTRYTGQYILMTHHGVFKECLPLQGDNIRGNDELDPLYTSDGENFINSLSNKPIMCINGHLHHFNNTKAGSIPVLSNPRGYFGKLSQSVIELDKSESFSVSDTSLKLFKPAPVERAYVYMLDSLAGVLYRAKEGLIFEYDQKYIAKAGEPLNPTMPLRKEHYVNAALFGQLLNKSELKLQANITSYPESDYLSILAIAELDLACGIDVRTSTS
jgi:UDP-2,3-diacylglucosamine pyrophosphatase LpxH